MILSCVEMNVFSWLYGNVLTFLCTGPYLATEVACVEFLLLTQLKFSRLYSDTGAQSWCVVYICFCLKLDAVFSWEALLQCLKGCAGFCSALCDFIIEGHLAAGIVGLCAAICMASSQVFLSLHVSTRQDWSRTSVFFWSCSDGRTYCQWCWSGRFLSESSILAMNSVDWV